MKYRNVFFNQSNKERAFSYMSLIHAITLYGILGYNLCDFDSEKYIKWSITHYQNPHENRFLAISDSRKDYGACYDRFLMDARYTRHNFLESVLYKEEFMIVL